MPRQARLDYPGALHHVIARGVARQRIFNDEKDYQAMARNLERLVPESGARCLAWSFLPNHIHVLIRSGKRPLSWLMHRLLLRHSMYYNRRNDRPGHLFQNRYRSILCEEDYYLKELIRYIHLNPLRAGLVKSLNELQRYRWCGHGAVAGVRLAKWQAVDDALEPFGGNYNEARSKYKRFVAEGVGIGRQPEYSRGGIIPGADGAEGASAVAELRGRTKCDERILGSGAFVANILRDIEHRDRRKMGLQRLMRPKDVVKRAAKIIGVKPGCVYARDRRSKPAQARFLACKWLVEDLGVSVSGVARLLKVTPAAVSHDVTRGRQVEKEYKAKLK